MPKHGKKYMDAAAKVDSTRSYQPTEAIELTRETSTTSFDATVEVHIRLSVDPRHADQLVRDVVLLPHGLGKEVRVLVFAQGEGASLAKDMDRAKVRVMVNFFGRETPVELDFLQVEKV